MLRLALLVVQNLGRNKLRTLLTMLGTMVLVMVVTLIWSVLAFLDAATAEKTNNLKAIVSERWRLPSQMPYAYAQGLREAGAVDPDDFRPLDSMTWSFVGGSLDPKARTRENSLFAFCLQPEKLLTMMGELEDMPPPEKAEFAKIVEKLKENRRGMIIGIERLAAINKRVGERIVMHSFNYKDISFEIDIVGTFPDGRYNNSAAMNIEYLENALDAYKRSHNGTPHPLADKSLNLVWLRVPDMAAYQRASQQILENPSFSNPAVKVETEASGVSAFLEAYRDLIWGMRVLLAPAIMLTLASVIANAISISVRERQLEFAVMKVLGFRPNQLLALVLGESLVLGTAAGFASAALTYYVVNDVYGGLKFPIAFFGAFYIPIEALYWGPLIGVGTAFVGSFMPAWTARSVKVSDVFAKVA
ncbi:MAG: ABC transporter permease [Planctomycetaceae bacterium]|nr:ABC transporter permease [Planctomycetaceae bacterium]